MGTWTGRTKRILHLEGGRKAGAGVDLVGDAVLQVEKGAGAGRSWKGARAGADVDSAGGGGGRAEKAAGEVGPTFAAVTGEGDALVRALPVWERKWGRQGKKRGRRTA